MPFELTDDFKKAIDAITYSGSCLFVTGRAGTGKSTLLRYFVENSVCSAIVLAPTGVAALNAKGQTIHSFFKIMPQNTLENPGSLPSDAKKVIKAADLIIIDEISMVRADLLDLVDLKLKKALGNFKPFGGKKMVFFGDLYQLPPVVSSMEREFIKDSYLTPYFFSAACMLEVNLQIIELEHIFRQKDKLFIQLLNSIRNNTVTDEQINVLNKRVLPESELATTHLFVRLVPVNKLADEVNQKQLSEIDEELFVFPAFVDGLPVKWQFPTERDLHVKVGAQIMMVNNDPQARWVNGSLARVCAIYREEDDWIVEADLEDGKKVQILPYEWDAYDYQYDKSTGRILAEKSGTFIQYPFKLAWAITIHKSQGKTYTSVILDFGKGLFSPGQAYVALSRCVSLEGLILKTPLKRNHVFVDRKISDFLMRIRYAQSDNSLSLEEKNTILNEAVNNRSLLKIIYLNASDEKSERIIKPLKVGIMRFNGKDFPGVEAYCQNRKANRTFRLDRILEVEPLG